MRLWMVGLGLLAATPVRADEQLWFINQLRADVDDRWSVQFEWQPRLTNGMSRLGDNLFGPSLSYRINDRVVVSGAYTAAINNPRARPIRREHRLTQQLQMRLLGEARGTRLTSRTRLEQRFIEDNDDPAMRFRQMLRVDVPVSEAWTVLASGEAFFGLESAGWGQSAGLDQFRTMVGVNYKVSRQMFVEVAVQDQRFSRPLPQPPNRVGILTLSYSLN
jgi:hypothetical protein